MDNKNNIINFNLFNKKLIPQIASKKYMIIINFSKVSYLNQFIGHYETDKIFKKFYEYCLDISEHHYLNKFDRLFLFFDMNKYKKEDIIQNADNVIKEFKTILGKYKKEITKVSKKEGYSGMLVPYIQILIDKNDNIYDFYIETFVEKYDQLFYQLNSFGAKNYLFNLIDFNLNSFEI